MEKNPLPPPDKQGAQESRLGRAFAEFVKVETLGAMTLAAAALIAIIIAQTPVGDSFHHFWNTKVGWQFDRLDLRITFHALVNDFLMAIFFFVVGLEIKREVRVGELSSPRRAMLPLLAAAGGMLFPALAYLALNPSGDHSRGWGIATATDIAFSLGVLSMLGTRAPAGLKIFLTALAIADDLGAVLVIALFYTAEVQYPLFAGALFAAWLCHKLGRAGWTSNVLLAVFGLIIWSLIYASGIHSTLAGIVLAFAIPTLHRGPHATRKPDVARLEGLIHALHPWVTFAIIPLFALANSGVRFSPEALLHPVGIGIALGLLIGKPLGIVGVSLIAAKLGWAQLPRGVQAKHLAGVGMLAGIGFTMSLFIAALAFPEGPLLESAKAGILVASTLAGFIGFFWLRSVSGVRPAVAMS